MADGVQNDLARGERNPVLDELTAPDVEDDGGGSDRETDPVMAIGILPSVIPNQRWRPPVTAARTIPAQYSGVSPLRDGR